MARIALFVTNFRGGGAEKFMINLANGFLDAGCQVDFLVVNTQGVYHDLLSKDANVINFNKETAKETLKDLMAYLKKEKPDVLVSALDAPNTVAILAKKLSFVKTKVVITLHMTIAEQFKKINNLHEWYSQLFIKKLFKRSDEIVCVSNDSAIANAKAIGVPVDRIKVFKIPVVTPYLLKSTAEPLDDPWFKEGQPPVLMGIGRFFEQKNFPLMLRAFAEVRKRVACRLFVLGEGDDRAALEQLVEELGIGEDVRLPGFDTNPYKFLKNARVFLLSSFWEASPAVIVEALACGTPVVSVNCPTGPRELLKDGQYGTLVEPENVQALADAIEIELAKPKIAQPLESYQPYMLSTVIDQYLEFMLDANQLAQLNKRDKAFISA